MKFLYSLICCLLSLNVALGQNAIPPSPEVENLFKFMHHPTDLFTGLPKINISLYDVNVQDVHVPISLSYNYSGYKPGEYDGKTGLGWILDQGGVVSRTIHGLPDDLATYGQLNTYDPIFDIPTLHTKTKYQEYQYLRDVIEGEKDIEYDIFNYSVAGETNSFILKKNGPQVEVIKLNANNSTKVVPVFQTQTQNLRGFEITDNQGNTYIYGIGRNDENVSEFENGTVSQHTTSWFLTRIIDKNSIDTVYFDYGPSQQVIGSDFYINKSRVLYHVEKGVACNAISGAQGENFINIDPVYYTRFLDRISFRGGSVDFSYDGRYLAQMLVRNYMNDTVRNFSFHYSALAVGHHYKKLDSISQPDGQSYVFNYHLPSAGFQVVHPGNMGRDWLGYYNGLSLFENPSIGYGGTLLGNARRVSHVDTRSFALHRIHYPTKGYCELIWENNKGRINSQVVDIPGLRIRMMEYVPLIGKSVREEYRYGQNEDGTGEIVVPYIPGVVLNANSSAFMTGQSFWFGEGSGENCAPYYYKVILSGSMYLPTNRNLSGNVYYRYVNKYMLGELNLPSGKESYEYIVPIYYQDMARDQYLARYWFDNPIKSPSEFDFPFGESILAGNSVVGQLKSKTIYKSSSGGYVAQRRETFSYTQSTVHDISYLKTARLATYGGCTYPGAGGGGVDNQLDVEQRIAHEISLGYSESEVLGWNSECQTGLLAPFYAYKQYYIRSTYSFLSEEEVVDYSGSDSIVRKTLHTYAAMTPLLTSSTEHHSPYGTALFIQGSTHSYPGQLGDPFYAIESSYPSVNTAMEGKNFFPRISSKDVYASNVQGPHTRSGSIGGNTEYGLFQSGKVFKKYEFVIASEYNPLEQTNYSNAIRGITEYKSYDTFGNPLEVEIHDGPIAAYMWGYNGLYPIAKVENATYATIVSVLGQSLIDQLNAPAADDALVQGTLQSLRNHPSMQKAQVTTYTYRPLVGMTSMTDPSGLTEHYGYDGFGRLSVVRDHEDNIVRTYCYNYAGQQVDCYGEAVAPTVYGNAARSQAFTRNNCPAGQQGGSVTYTVPAGTYTSTVSQAAADGLAQSDVNANGQAHANANGTCTAASTCTRYRITIPGHVLQQYNGELFIGYQACGSSLRQVVSIHHLPAEVSGDCTDCHVLEVCMDNASWGATFHQDQFGPALDIPGVGIVILGPCN